MRISMNHHFERRIGIWPAGFDSDGELYCDQRYGDWPIKTGKTPFAEPDWMLLSYKAKVTASSYAESNPPANISDENIRTWWKAGTNESGEWVLMDLGQNCTINAVQVNFADDNISAAMPEGAVMNWAVFPRYIDERKHITKWKLEASENGTDFFTVEDKSQAETNLPHDFIISNEGFHAEYLKLTVYQVPFGEPACVSGLRVFGKADGEKPQVPSFKAQRLGDLDMEISIDDNNADGYNILWGHAPDKLYHSYMVFDQKVKIGALVKGQDYFVRLDAFNKCGITKGSVTALKK
jgi:hypothetical protein